MDLLELEPLPFSFRLFIVVLALVNFGISWLCEKCFFESLAGWITALSKYRRRRGLGGGNYAQIGSTSGKMYKRLIEEMEPLT